MEEKTKLRLNIEIEKACEALFNEKGFHIVDIDVKGGKNKQITLLIYSKNSFGIDELGKLSKTVYPVIEKLPFLKDGFSLEISSPGIYRNIKYFKEFNIYKERIIKVITNNEEVFIGTLNGHESNYIKLNIDDKEKVILLDDIKSANLNG